MRKRKDGYHHNKSHHPHQHHHQHQHNQHQQQNVNNNNNSNNNNNNNNSSNNNNNANTTNINNKEYVPATKSTPVQPVAPPVLTSLDDDPTMNQLDDIIANIERMQVPHSNNTLRFEFTLLLFLLCYLCIQNYNIYRANFFNYNFNLLILTSIILCKRLLVKYLKSVKRDNPFSLSTPQICFNLLVLASILSNSFYFVYQLFLRHSLRNFMFLFYPAVSYFLFFGFNTNKHRTPTEKATYKFKKILFNTIECGYLAGFLPMKFLQSEYIYFDPIRAIILIVYLVANCFVMFLTHLLTNSFYELYIHAQTFGCWCSCSPSFKVSYFGNMFHLIYKDPAITNNLARLQQQHTSQPSPQKQSASKVATNSTKGQVTNAKIELSEWNPKHGPYPRGSVVLHHGKVYVAIGLWNGAEPGHWSNGFLFFLFARPDRMHTMLIILQTFIAITQLVLVFYSAHWRVYAVMLLLNYHILYSCITTRRDNLQYYSYYHVSKPDNSFQ